MIQISSVKLAGCYSSTMESYQRILHPIDLNEISRPAFCHALKLSLCATGYPTLAPDLRRPAVLEMLHCHEPIGGPAYAAFPRVRRRLARWGVIHSDAQAQELQNLGLSVRKRWVEGDPGQQIARLNEERHCDFLVMATHARAGWSHYLEHSVSAPAVQACRTPGLLIPHDSEGFVEAQSGRMRLRRILIPVCSEPAAPAALEAVLRLLQTLSPSLGEVGGQLMQVFVGPESEFPEYRLPEPPAGWTWTRQVLEGRPVEALRRWAGSWQPQLVAMASRGQRTWQDRWFGSTAEKLLNALRCPVLLVPGYRSIAA